MKRALQYLVFLALVTGISAFVFLRLIPSAQRHENTVLETRPIDELLGDLHDCTWSDIKRRVVKCGKRAEKLIAAVKRSSPADYEFVKRSNFDVYLRGGNVIYLRENCKDSDLRVDRFSLDYWPQKVSVLPENRKKYGFVSIDFLFSEEGYRTGNSCLVLKTFRKSGGAKKLATGQHLKGKGRVWTVEYP